VTAGSWPRQGRTRRSASGIPQRGKRADPFQRHRLDYPSGLQSGRQRLAASCRDYTIKFWEVTTGQEAITLRGHNRAVLALAFSPDGHRLATAALEKEVRVWDGTPPRSETAANGGVGSQQYQWAGWVEWDRTSRSYMT